MSHLADAMLRDVSAPVIRAAEPNPAHAALALGIWTEKSSIDRAEIERLRVLWGRYF